jgi:hypothetical protein
VIDALVGRIAAMNGIGRMVLPGVRWVGPSRRQVLLWVIDAVWSPKTVHPLPSHVSSFVTGAMARMTGVISDLLGAW